MPDPKQAVEGYESPFIGFRFFLSKPKLWLIPLIGMCVTWLILFSIVFFVTYKAWPEQQPSQIKYTWKIVQAIGFGVMIGLSTWLVLFPFLLNLAFEHLIKQVYLAKGDTLSPLPFFQTVFSGGYVVVKTLHWRIAWIVLGCVMIVVCAPITLLIFQLGMTHSALLDGCDLSLSVKGMHASARLALLRKHKLGILLGGIIAGVVSTFLMPTVLVWFFWIPGIYVGAALWACEWV